MNSKPPKPNSQVSIYMNHQNEMEIAEMYSNLPYTLKKIQDFTFSEIKFLVGGGSGPPPPLQALCNLLYYLWFFCNHTEIIHWYFYYCKTQYSFLLIIQSEIIFELESNA